MELLIGDNAPDFTLKNQNGEDVTLSSFQGKKPVVLVFFPMAFTGICTGELCELRDNFAQFEDNNVELLAISCDTKYVQKVFAEQEGYNFDVLSDFWPHGAVASAYGVFLEDLGFSNRATFVIDKAGVLAAKFITAPGQPRNLADYQHAIAALA